LPAAPVRADDGWGESSSSARSWRLFRPGAAQRDSLAISHQRSHPVPCALGNLAVLLARPAAACAQLLAGDLRQLRFEQEPLISRQRTEVPAKPGELVARDRDPQRVGA